MTAPPGAWPQANEDLYGGGPGSRSQLIDDLKAQLSAGQYVWDTKKTGVFEISTWSGKASGTAKRRTDAHSTDMQSVDQLLSKAETFYENTYRTIVNAKNEIIEICNHYQSEIDRLSKESFTNEDDRTTAINAQIQQALEKNKQVVNAAAQAVQNGVVYKPQDVSTSKGNGVQALTGEFGNSASAPGNSYNPDGVVRNAPLSDSSSPTNAYTPVGGTPQQLSAEREAASAPTNAPTPVGGTPQQLPADPEAASAPTNAPTPTQGTPQQPPTAILAGPRPSPVPPPSAAPPIPAGVGVGVPGSSSAPGGSSYPVSSGGSGPGGSGGGGSHSGDGKYGAHGLEKAAAGPGKDGAGKTPEELTALAAPAASAAQPALIPTALSAPSLIPSLPPVDASAIANAVISHTAAAVPDPGGGPVGGGHGGPGGGGPGGGGGGGGSIAPPMGGIPAVPPMPLGPPSTPPPVTATPPAPSQSPNVNPASGAKSDILPAPIPVSAVRAERDAVLAASAAGTMAAGGANAALVMARRIAAALNVGPAHFGFFWITGLTADGTIVVANSYGLGYIPEPVNLPENVKMATADESIPMADRAKWATYPILALQGWAQAHDQKLRAVFATESQFASFDPGAAKVILQPDDIPDSGAMKGRSRLEVIAPGAAAHLASVPDGGLNDLLPAAPADTSPPEDNSAAMWFNMAIPLTSTTSDRGIAHMQLMVQYADHAQELALYRAHTAADAALQRAAIADWVYWQHLSVLMSDAIGSTANV
jgi:hypothetical protein